MDLGIDAYAHLDSPLHRWDPRTKLVGLMALIFAFSFVQDLRLLPVILLMTAALFAASRLPLAFLRTRLRYPGYFLLFVAVLLPFVSGGPVLLSVGPLDVHTEGVLSVVLIVAKFVAILTTGLVLFGTAPFLTTIKAMRSLGLPSLLSDMTLLAYRYLFEVAADLQAMEMAMRLRGFRLQRLSRRAMSVLSSLAGSILVRSYERSDRVYKAMVLRGYGGAAPADDVFETMPRDWLLLSLVLLMAASVLVVEYAMRSQGG